MRVKKEKEGAKLLGFYGIVFGHLSKKKFCLCVVGFRFEQGSLVFKIFPIKESLIYDVHNVELQSIVFHI